MRWGISIVPQPTQPYSIIVPITETEQAWEQLLDQLSLLGHSNEVIIVAPDAADFTTLKESLNKHKKITIKLISSQKGRARQLNTGAKEAQNPWLWFLHADSKLPTSYKKTINKKAKDNNECIYFFDLYFSPMKPWLMLINMIGVWFRCRIYQLPYGDQGLFMPKHLFQKLGEFDENISVGEDLIFIKEALKQNTPIKPIGNFIGTSPRKYQDKGWWFMTRYHLSFTFKNK